MGKIVKAPAEQAVIDPTQTATAFMQFVTDVRELAQSVQDLKIFLREINIKELVDQYKENEDEVCIKFKLDQKIRLETARDILKLSKEEFEYYIKKRWIAPVNKRNYFLVSDVMQLKETLQSLQTLKKQ